MESVALLLYCLHTPSSPGRLAHRSRVTVKPWQSVTAISAADTTTADTTTDQHCSGARRNHIVLHASRETGSGMHVASVRSEAPHPRLPVSERAEQTDRKVLVVIRTSVTGLSLSQKVNNEPGGHWHEAAHMKTKQRPYFHVLVSELSFQLRLVRRTNQIQHRLQPFLFHGDRNTEEILSCFSFCTGADTNRHIFIHYRLSSGFFCPRRSDRSVSTCLKHHVESSGPIQPLIFTDYPPCLIHSGQQRQTELVLLERVWSLHESFSCFDACREDLTTDP